MIEPIIIRHFLDIAGAQQDLAASLKRAVKSPTKSKTAIRPRREAIVAVLKGNGRGPTADADPINVSCANGAEHSVLQ
jgi:hypothetical protein